MGAGDDRGRIYAGRSDGGIDIRALAGCSSRWLHLIPLVLRSDQSDADCKDALGRLSAELVNIPGVSVASDWNTAHSDVERNGGLIFGTQGLLSLQFVVASMASVASAFVFLSLVLTQRKKELAILQAIGASTSQIIKLVLFEILAIVGMSMGLGILLGLGIAQSFNGFFWDIWFHIPDFPWIPSGRG